MTDAVPPPLPAAAPTLKDAVEWHRRGLHAQAAAAYRLLLREAPDDPLVWTNLGAALRSLGKAEAAIACHRRALHHGPGNATAIANLGNALRERGDFDEARRMAVVEGAGIETGSPATVARDMQGMGRWRASLVALDAAIAADPDDADLPMLRATSHFMTGNFRRGLEDYAARFRFSPGSEPMRRSPRWTGGRATGRRLLVMAEQGLGDMVMVSRFLPRLREKWEEIWLTSRGPTLRLFDGVPHVDRVFRKDRPPKEGTEDAHVPAMDLMRLFDLTPQTCPAPAPLSIPGTSRRRAARIVAPYSAMFRVGIAWAGSPSFVQARRKATGLDPFLDLATVPGVQLFGMSKGAPEAEIAALGAEGLVVNTAATDRDLADAAALCERMDLIVTVDTGLAHVAGTLGVPVWTLLGRPPFWYWGPYGEETYWYRSMRLIRQDAPGDWSGPFATVRRDLEALVL